MDRFNTVAEGAPTKAASVLPAAVAFRAPCGRLELHGVQDEPLVHHITRSVTRVGSSDQCDFCITSPVVSKQHLAIIMKPNGITFVEDTGSRNGTYLWVGNEKTVCESATRFAVQTGSRVDLGASGKIFFFLRDLKRPDSLSLSDDDEVPPPAVESRTALLAAVAVAQPPQASTPAPVDAAAGRPSIGSSLASFVASPGSAQHLHTAMPLDLDATLDYSGAAALPLHPAPFGASPAGALAPTLIVSDISPARMAALDTPHTAAPAAVAAAAPAIPVLQGAPLISDDDEPPVISTRSAVLAAKRPSDNPTTADPPSRRHRPEQAAAAVDQDDESDGDLQVPSSRNAAPRGQAAAAAPAVDVKVYNFDEDGNDEAPTSRRAPAPPAPAVAEVKTYHFDDDDDGAAVAPRAAAAAAAAAAVPAPPAVKTYNNFDDEDGTPARPSTHTRGAAQVDTDELSPKTSVSLLAVSPQHPPAAKGLRGPPPAAPAARSPPASAAAAAPAAAVSTTPPQAPSPRALKAAAPAAAPAATSAQWQYKSDLRLKETNAKAWSAYSAVDSAQIEGLYQTFLTAGGGASCKDKKITDPPIGDGTYHVDFVNMIQYRADDVNRQRPIRRQ